MTDEFDDLCWVCGRRGPMRRWSIRGPYGRQTCCERPRCQRLAAEGMDSVPLVREWRRWLARHPLDPMA